MNKIVFISIHALVIAINCEAFRLDVESTGKGNGNDVYPTPGAEALNCMAKTYEECTNCTEKAAKDRGFDPKTVDPKSKAFCCGEWDAIDCYFHQIWWGWNPDVCLYLT